jgi:hypothetical protein
MFLLNAVCSNKNPQAESAGFRKFFFFGLRLSLTLVVSQTFSLETDRPFLFLTISWSLQRVHFPAQRLVTKTAAGTWKSIGVFGLESSPSPRFFASLHFQNFACSEINMVLYSWGSGDFFALGHGNSLAESLHPK